ncbi:hypothetical protein Hanom_Chr01g00061351 [Helianthus anomalus]
MKGRPYMIIVQTADITSQIICDHMMGYCTNQPLTFFNYCSQIIVQFFPMFLVTLAIHYVAKCEFILRYLDEICLRIFNHTYTQLCVVEKLSNFTISRGFPTLLKSKLINIL